MKLDEIRDTPRGEEYQPYYERKLTGEPSGTTITLKDLTRKYRINLDTVRAKVARRFACIGPNFQVSINGPEISAEDRAVRAKCEYVWEIEDAVKKGEGWSVVGWIGTTPEPVARDIGAGVVIMARGKLVQEPTLFEVKTTGWVNMASGYLVGELHADFLDEEEDLIITNRSSIVWDSPEGGALEAWGQDKIKEISADWVGKRTEKRHKKILEDPEYEEWYNHLTVHEKRVAKRVIKAITTGSDMPEERVVELANYMRESFDHQVFRELVDAIDESPSEARGNLVALFKEWSLIEAKEVLRVAKGRLAAIEKLEKYIWEDAREVPEIHDFLAEYPWILDPTWTIVEDESYYSKLLRKKFPEESLDEPNRRIDFVCLGAGDTIYIVELKRPGHNLGVKDLDQLADYVAFVRHRLGNAPDGRAYRSAAGYILCEGIQDNYRVQARKELLEKDRMYVKKYADLLATARRLHRAFEEKIRAKRESPPA